MSKELADRLEWIDEARQIAAQCWCDPETEQKIMDPVLAEAIAKRIALWMETGAQHAKNEEYWRERATKAEESIAALRSEPVVYQYETLGYALAMRVLQSGMYQQLDDRERAECDELIQTGLAAPSREDRSEPVAGQLSAEKLCDCKVKIADCHDAHNCRVMALLSLRGTFADGIEAVLSDAELHLSERQRSRIRALAQGQRSEADLDIDAETSRRVKSVDRASQSSDHPSRTDSQEPADHRVCHAPGERCLSCDHYQGKAPVCRYATAEPSLSAKQIRQARIDLHAGSALSSWLIDKLCDMALSSLTARDEFAKEKAALSQQWLDWGVKRRDEGIEAAAKLCDELAELPGNSYETIQTKLCAKSIRAYGKSIRALAQGQRTSEQDADKLLREVLDWGLPDDLKQRIDAHLSRKEQ